jgi:hypothetical protein
VATCTGRLDMVAKMKIFIIIWILALVAALGESDLNK